MYYAQPVESTGRVAGMRLKANGDFSFAASQFFGNCVGHVEKLARLVVLQRLGGDHYAVSQDVKLPRPRFTSPVGTNQSHGLVWQDLQVERNPSTIARVSPFATRMFAGLRAFALHVVIAFGLHLSGLAKSTVIASSRRAPSSSVL